MTMTNSYVCLPPLVFIPELFALEDDRLGRLASGARSRQNDVKAELMAPPVALAVAALTTPVLNLAGQ